VQRAARGNRSPASRPFRTAERDARGGDFVDSVIKGRVVLAKKTLHTRIRYQIEKLVRVADDASKNVADAKSYSLALIGAH
jgi:U3 small nucleolar ribonucleoprotein protein LCP5